jgi:hypothetical protein
MQAEYDVDDLYEALQFLCDLASPEECGARATLIHRLAAMIQSAVSNLTQTPPLTSGNEALF